MNAASQTIFATENLSILFHFQSCSTLKLEKNPQERQQFPQKQTERSLQLNLENQTSTNPHTHKNVKTKFK